MNRFAEVRDLIINLESDFQKFYDKQNKAAGTRVRKGMQELKNLAQDIRLAVQAAKNEETGGKKTTGAKKSSSPKAGAAKSGGAKSKSGKK
ncbi:MAG: hypothetical protein EOP53_15045 [Sphingobacteriales bacterium]|nr:MAG: hypothetical protein EOP53_15045 [Sphingobacteriales bacterium]